MTKANIYRENFHITWAKIMGFHGRKSHQKWLSASHGVPSASRHAPGDLVCHFGEPRASCCASRVSVNYSNVFLYSSHVEVFSSLLSYLVTWEHNSSLCKVFWDLLNLHSSSSQGPIISGGLALLDFLYFFVFYVKNPPKLICFRKYIITYSNIENITNVLKS